MSQISENPGAAPGSCCSPSTSAVTEQDTSFSSSPPESAKSLTPAQRRATGAVTPVRHDLREIPLGAFLMGTDDPDQNAEDHEGPVRPVSVAAFHLAATTVTNGQFAEFIAQTGHRTTAETLGWSFVFHLLLHPLARRHTLPGRVPGAPWWRGVEGASWQHPDGPGSHVEDRLDHPVVHVSWIDAQAYCSWSGTRLPSESEWEYAARGGLEQRRFPWGDELRPDGQHRCNIWQGTFPTHNTQDDGWLGTGPADAYQPNGYGLHAVVGNVWEWCQDAWSPQASDSQLRVIRGGSYLCHDSYCNRYRVAARSSNSIESSTGNMGFRVASDT